MSAEPMKLGIVGLGRWAKCSPGRREIGQAQIVAGYSRTEDKRRAFQQEFGVAGVPDMKTLLSDPDIRGVIITVPNEQHLPVATEIAKAGKHVYTEKPIAATLEDGSRSRRWKRNTASPSPSATARACSAVFAAFARRSMPANSAASPSSRRISPTSVRSSSIPIHGAGTKPRRRRAAVAACNSSIRYSALPRRRYRRGKFDGLQAFAGRRRG